MQFIKILDRINLVYREIEEYPRKLDVRTIPREPINSKICDYCKCEYTEKNIKVAHHNHFTGEFIAYICNKCNVGAKENNLIIPVIAHNAKNYDQNFILRELAKYDCELNSGGKIQNISVIPKSDEKFLEITFKRLRFIDSYSFLTGSLEKLTECLKIQADSTNNYEELFAPVFENFKLYDKEIIKKYLLRKNVFPYEYCDSLEKFQETKLPPIECFYSSISNSNISQEDYEFAQDAFRTFNCINLKSYNMFYLKVDVVILASVFNNFRNLIFKQFNIDPCWYVSSPSLSWDLFLKETNIKLELISDAEVYDFFVQGWLDQKDIQNQITNINSIMINSNHQATSCIWITTLYILQQWRVQSFQ